MRRARNIARGPRGMTMIEILVALGILAVAIGSILTIFHAGARHGARAREKMAAGRVALAVFDLVDKGFAIGATSYGRDYTTGAVIDVAPYDSVTSEQLAGMTDGQPSWRPAHVANTPVPLVWKYNITGLDPATTDGVPLHRLSVTVAVDEDGDYIFDDVAPEPDRVVRVYEAILADRRVTP